MEDLKWSKPLITQEQLSLVDGLTKFLGPTCNIHVIKRRQNYEKRWAETKYFFASYFKNLVGRCRKIKL